MKNVYKIPFWSRVAMHIADFLPSRVRASIYIDALDSLDDEYKSVHVIEEDGIKREAYYMAVSGVHIEILRRVAYKEGLRAKIVELPPSPAKQGDKT
jgi:hypothetical protein